MNQINLATLCAVLLCHVVCTPAIAADKISTDESVIRQSAQEFVDAYNRADASAIAAEWTEDGEYKIGRESLKGRAAIAAEYKEQFKAHPGSKMKVDVKSVRLIAPTVAIEEGTASVSDSSNGPPSSSDYTALHVKQGDKWLMLIVRDSETPNVEFDRDLKELAWMVGDWTASSDKAKIELKCTWMANKNFLRLEITVHGGNGDIPGGVQVISRHPQSGDLVSWFFSANGGFGTGVWHRDGSRWIIQTEGVAADGTPTAATNILYRANDNVVSWQSTRRFLGDKALPNIKELVIERAAKP
jgi:uncharacterized protein (TIGR02246 family)